MTQRIRVLLLIPHLGGGGAEHVAALLARGLSREKYEIHFGLVTERSAPDGFSASVTLHPLGASRVRPGAFRLLRLVWRLRPHIVLSGMFHLNFLVLLLRPFFPPGTRVLVRQNATVSTALAAGGLPRSTRLLYKLLYPRADRVICQSSAMASDLAAQIDIGPERLAVLPNPVDLDAIRAAKNGPNRWSGPGPHLLAVGRLAPEKGFDLLLEAFPAVRARFPQADLVIAGAGAQEAPLKELCHRLGLDGAVLFPGYLHQPYVFYPGASLFVLSSRHEGMPNVLLEAAAAGLPVAALPCSGGVIDLLRGRPRAWLATEVSASALAATLLDALPEMDALPEVLDTVAEPGPPAPHPPSPCTLHTLARGAGPHVPPRDPEFAFDRAIQAYEELLDATFAARPA